MRQYNLFVVRSDYCKYNELLFDILNSLRTSNSDYGLYLFNQIFDKIDIDILNNYLNEKFNLNKKYTFKINDVVIKLKYSRIVISSKYNFPKILKFINYYNKNIFVVDFENKDFFWLNSFAKEKILI